MRLLLLFMKQVSLDKLQYRQKKQKILLKKKCFNKIP